MTARRMSHKKAILMALQKGDVLDQREATARWDCSRLAARIHELRKAGYLILSVRHTGEDRFSKYFLLDKSPVEVRS